MENKKYELERKNHSLSGKQTAYISSFGENEFALKLYHGYENLFIGGQYFNKFCSGLGIDYKDADQRNEWSGKNPWYYYLTITINDTNELHNKIYNKINSLSDKNNEEFSKEELNLEGIHATNKHIKNYSEFGRFVCECVKEISRMKNALEKNPNAELEVVNMTGEFKKFIVKDQ